MLVVITSKPVECAVAQQIQTLFIDDIDGGEAEGTVRFGLDGTDFEIDLSSAHSAELREALSAYVTHARRVSGSARRATRGHGTARPALDIAKVRVWAKENGFDIKDRGRVPADVVASYQGATRG
jgi:Lsr2